MRRITTIMLGESATRTKIIGIYGLLFAGNAGAWAWAFVAFHDFPVLIGTAMLAYSFGLRHAFDADHIVAIDNVTRKMMQEGKRPVTVGLFFSLGHSTIVVGLSVAIAIAATTLQTHSSTLSKIGEVAGTLISAAFLFMIAIANLLVVAAIFRTFQAVKGGQPFAEDDFNLLLAKRGLLGRLLRRLFVLIGRSWQMYPLGILFGLGFDTATEIGLLGMSANQASQGLSIGSILVFPALFTAGMTLADTTDNVLMLGAYGWAGVKPIRKLYYNLTITWLSAAIAIFVGGFEILNIIGKQIGATGDQGFWATIMAVNQHFSMLGYVIVGVFVGTWIMSWAIYRVMNYDAIAGNRSECSDVTPAISYSAQGQGRGAAPTTL